MKRIVCRFHAGNNPYMAVVALVALGVIAAVADAAPSARPQIGGTLRVEMNERVAMIDPRQWPSAPALAAAAERLDALVFDRLVSLDERGTIQPALAISWQHDAQMKRWQFRLRDGVKFSDGSPLTPPIVAIALQQLLGISFDVSAASDSVVIQSEHPLPELLSELATGRYFIFHSAKANSLTGTGPFRVVDWPTAESSAKAVFVAMKPAGRGARLWTQIELLMGVDPPAAGQCNLLWPSGCGRIARISSTSHRTAGRAHCIQRSRGTILRDCVCASRPAVQDARLRQAISLAIDRASIADVILQRQGVSAGGLLPNWISGYAHLFPVTSDLPRAKDSLAASGRELSRSMPLVLFFRFGRC